MQQFAHFNFDPSADLLGEGPQCTVYRARDSRLGRTVALKILRDNVTLDPDALQRFEREAKHTSSLGHPNIATIYEFGDADTDDRRPAYIAMEFLEGKPLDRLIKERSIGTDEGIRIGVQVTAALDLVHRRGIVHRDLKPANIMVLDDGRVKLLDFGICRSEGETNITQDGVLVGTVLYMSPEQVRGEDLDSRSDIFALGAVLYHATTGELPFPGDSFPEVCMSILECTPRRPTEVRSSYPPALEEFVLRCLSRDLDQRYPHGSAAHGALLAVADAMNASASAPRRVLEARLVIPPMGVTDERDRTRLFAAGLRRDLSSELSRALGLEVLLPEEGELPDDSSTTYILRGDLKISGQKGRVDLAIERSTGPGSPATVVWEEGIEHSDNDEWGLQAQLVGSVARTVRRKLTEQALMPVREQRADSEAAHRYTMHGHALLHLGSTRQLVGAISAFRRALEADPGCALAHAGMAEALVRKFLYWDGDRTFIDEATDYARRALALDSQCAEGHTSLGFAHAMTGRHADARKEYRLAIQLNHDEWLAHRLLGALLSREGNYRGAEPLLRRAVALKPMHIGSYDHLYGVLIASDRYEEAGEVAVDGIMAARHEIKRQPKNLEARIHLALLYARQGEEAQAHRALATIREVAPKDGYALFHVAMVHAILDELPESMEALGQAQSRGYYIESELTRNADLDALRALPGYSRFTG